MDYDDQLDRALDQTPEIGASDERLDIPDPTVREEGNVTVYENFQTTLDRIGREEEHVLKFLQDDLGTSARIDESGRARLTGSFRRDRIETVIEEYVDEYVRCPECGLPDTTLEREQEATFLSCDACGARSPVSQT